MSRLFFITAVLLSLEKQQILLIWFSEGAEPLTTILFSSSLSSFVQKSCDIIACSEVPLLVSLYFCPNRKKSPLLKIADDPDTFFSPGGNADELKRGKEEIPTRDGLFLRKSRKICAVQGSARVHALIRGCTNKLTQVRKEFP